MTDPVKVPLERMLCACGCAQPIAFRQSDVSALEAEVLRLRAALDSAPTAGEVVAEGYVKRAGDAKNRCILRFDADPNNACDLTVIATGLEVGQRVQVVRKSK